MNNNAWRNIFNEGLFIAGPCSAESSDQLLNITLYLKKYQQIDPRLKIVRAGIWKPRTRPNSFEGMGHKALPWIKEIKEITNLLFMTEVGTPKHIEHCLKYNIDCLWIGARTTANPFLVQEICNALKGVNIPIFIKNPINPDMALWIGAFERFSKAGIKQLAFIHRGFSSYESSPYRNKPIWEIPIKMKCEFPEIPMICDPSHMCGKEKYLFNQTCQFALDLNYQGIMVETHYNPQIALSDADQQLNEMELNELFKNLHFKKKISEQDDNYLSRSLEELRREIFLIDQQILQNLSERLKIVNKIKVIKDQLDLSNLQVEQWNSMMNKYLQTSKEMNIDQKFVTQIFETIHSESIRLQSNEQLH